SFRTGNQLPVAAAITDRNPRRSTKPSGFRFGCVGRGFARDFAELARLLAQDLHLRSNKLVVQRQQGLRVLGVDQLLRVVESSRDVLLGKTHYFIADFLSSRLRNL